MKKSTFFSLVFLLLGTVAYAQNAVVLNALKDELRRSVEQLKLEGEATPYYLSYLLKDTYSLRIAADSGAITTNSDSRVRTLKIDLRVGNYNQDNSNFLSANLPGLSAMLTTQGRLATDDDYEVLRRQIWRATDAAYKSALETLAKKKAFLQNTVQTEPLPDFTQGGALSSLVPEVSFSVPRSQLEQTVDQLSKLFVGQPKIQRSKVEIKIQAMNSYYVNSEGAVSVEPASASWLTVSGLTQADDGMPLRSYLVYSAIRPEGLPARATLEGEIKSLIAGLTANRTAPVAEDYSGPVLFESQAAGELFGQGFANFLVGRRSTLSDNAQINAMMARMENPFLSRVNMKVAANILSVKAVPAMKSYNQKSLLGAYLIDEEGVNCRDVNLIENGMLKNLLTARAPIKGFAQSNGHSRGGTATPSVIQVESSKKLPAAELKQEFLKAVKEEGLTYGYLIKGLTPVLESADTEDSGIESMFAPQSGPPEATQFRLTRPYSVYRVYLDGKEEPVRGIELSSLNINVLKNVIATSEDSIVYDFPVNVPNPSAGMSSLLAIFIGGRAIGQESYATVITPSLLISGIELKKVSGNFQKPPIAAYPQ